MRLYYISDKYVAGYMVDTHKFCKEIIYFKEVLIFQKSLDQGIQISVKASVEYPSTKAFTFSVSPGVVPLATCILIFGSQVVLKHISNNFCLGD